MTVMALGSRIVGIAVAEQLANPFISATFLTDPDYMRRFKQVQNMEES